MPLIMDIAVISIIINAKRPQPLLGRGLRFEYSFIKFLSIQAPFAIINLNLIKFITVDLVRKLTVFQIC